MRLKNRLLGKVGQLIIVILIAMLMLQNFYMVNLIQGAGRVINYTGIVRGVTQRLIKLEIAGQPKDELISYLDDIINDLHYGGGQYNLYLLKDADYQEKLQALMKEWDKLKLILTDYRLNPSLEDKLMSESETYFTHANEMVSAAEVYSEGNARRLRIYEIILFVGVVLLVAISLKQTINEIRLTRKNKELRAAAYYDRLTGIPSRRRCEEVIWGPVDVKTVSYCAVMFDLNNLKQVNDSLGHQTGDKLIKAFAEILVKFNSEKVFVGRYGGDEFIMVIHDYDEPMVVRLLKDIQNEVDEFNYKNDKFKIFYASGYNFQGDTLQKMVERADERMYENKRRMKEEQARL